jgi:hypothetical protein
VAEVKVPYGVLAMAKRYGTPLTEQLSAHVATAKKSDPNGTHTLTVVLPVDDALIADAHAAFAQLIALPAEGITDAPRPA